MEESSPSRKREVAGASPRRAFWARPESLDFIPREWKAIKGLSPANSHDLVCLMDKTKGKTAALFFSFISFSLGVLHPSLSLSLSFFLS